MIVHKTLTERTSSWMAENTLAKQENLREKAQEFIARELNEEDVINLAETLMSAGNGHEIGGLFSVTVWYRKR
jgi:hypothetical protein